ncbi:unnamed protein product [Protopolystoma xenopodis]|uniref:Uncharacterized protein n=1 Tax=Protopolystoma xenopodis TaxID=117903 RepID=A0A448WHX0_9PLAT|nr:unnamed protein product [Protopolystoma xenopodis]
MASRWLVILGRQRRNNSVNTAFEVSVPGHLGHLKSHILTGQLGPQLPDLASSRRRSAQRNPSCTDFSHDRDQNQLKPGDEVESSSSSSSSDSEPRESQSNEGTRSDHSDASSRQLERRRRRQHDCSKPVSEFCLQGNVNVSTTKSSRVRHVRLQPRHTDWIESADSNQDQSVDRLHHQAEVDISLW